MRKLRRAGWIYQQNAFYPWRDPLTATLYSTEQAKAIQRGRKDWRIEKELARREGA
jgi:hypothetical protein